MTAPDRRKEGPERRRLEGSVADLAAEVVRLRGAVERRPSRFEVAYRRRFVGASVALFAVLLISAHDEHVERCAPGARTAEQVERILGGTERPEDVLREGLPPAARVCDLTFPLHTHQGGRWPSELNALGLTVYGVLAGGLAVWVRRPLRKPEQED